MPNFSVPNQINPGDASDATKAMANWNQVVTDLNGSGATGGGKIDATNVAAAFANGNVEPAFSTYKTVYAVSVNTANTVPIGSTLSGTITLPSKGALAGTDAIQTAFWVDPADYTAGSRTTKYRLRAVLFTNATAPAITFTVGLYPLSSVAGAVNTVTGTYGSVVAGSTVAFASPSASAITQGNSGDFTPPAAGAFSFAVALSSNPAANSGTYIAVSLQARQV